MVRLILSCLAFVAILLIGDALGIHPTLAECLVVIVACAVADAVRDF